jgi:hypothetical protein
MQCCICGRDMTGQPAMVDKATGEAFCSADSHYFGMHPSNRPQRPAFGGSGNPSGMPSPPVSTPSVVTSEPASGGRGIVVGTVGAPAEPKPNPFQRIIGVLTAPVPTFDSIAKRPDVLVPLIILIVFSIVANVLIARNVDFASITRQAIEDSQSSTQQMTSEQMDRAVRFGSAIAKAMTYAGPILQIIVLAVIAGLMLISFRMFGGEGDYKQAFSITVYSWYPLTIFGIISMIVLLSRKSISVIDLGNPVRSNLGFLANMKTQPFAYAILSSLDVFSFWTMALMVIGYAAMSRMSKGKAAAVVITYWVLYVGIFKMIGAALSSMRAKA